MIKEKNKRSPLKSKPLRCPGESSDKKIDELFYDNLFIHMIIVFVFSIITGLEWIRKFCNTPPHPWLYTAATLILFIYFLPKFIKIKNKIDNYKLGRDGEKIVAENLYPLIAKGYKIYNDMEFENFNIDHVIVGPGGVFIIETKTYRKSNKKSPIINYNGEIIKKEGKLLLNDPVFQVKGERLALQNLIELKAGIKINVYPIVVFPGWYIEPLNYNNDVLVLNEKLLFSYLDKKENILDKDIIELISSHIEKHIRS